MPSPKTTTKKVPSAPRVRTAPAKAASVVPPRPVGYAEDVAKNRALAAMSYFWIFCIIPLLAKKESPYAQFHAKQGVVVAFTWFLLWMANIVPLLGQIVFFLGVLPLIAVNLLAIMKAWNGEEWKIPYLHKYVAMLNL